MNSKLRGKGCHWWQCSEIPKLVCKWYYKNARKQKCYKNWAHFSKKFGPHMLGVMAIKNKNRRLSLILAIKICMTLAYISIIWWKFTFTMNVWGANTLLELYFNKCFLQNVTVKWLFLSSRHIYRGAIKLLIIVILHFHLI